MTLLLIFAAVISGWASVQAEENNHELWHLAFLVGAFGCMALAIWTVVS